VDVECAVKKDVKSIEDKQKEVVVELVWLAVKKVDSVLRLEF
jgi:hypothetical protein